MSPTLDLALQLIRRPSVTPNDAECQQLLADRLQAIGFKNEALRFDNVDNLWAGRMRALVRLCRTYGRCARWRYWRVEISTV